MNRQKQGPLVYFNSYIKIWILNWSFVFTSKNSIRFELLLINYTLTILNLIAIVARLALETPLISKTTFKDISFGGLWTIVPLLFIFSLFEVFSSFYRSSFFCLCSSSQVMNLQDKAGVRQAIFSGIGVVWIPISVTEVALSQRREASLPILPGYGHRRRSVEYFFAQLVGQTLYLHVGILR